MSSSAIPGLFVQGQTVCDVFQTSSVQSRVVVVYPPMSLRSAPKRSHLPEKIVKNRASV